MQLSENIVWTVDAQIKDSEKLTLAMKMITEATFQEEGSLNHEWFVAEDGISLHVYERYTNSEAALSHLETWSKYASLFMEASDMINFKVYGDLSPELHKVLGGANSIMKTYGGFAK